MHMLWAMLKFEQIHLFHHTNRGKIRQKIGIFKQFMRKL